MSIEMYCLLVIAILMPVTAVLAAGLYGQQVGNSTLIGNRENLPPPDGIAGRARRAHANLLENALPFAIVILLAANLGVTNSLTLAGALGFVFFRLVHLASYLAGVTVIRTAAYHLGTLSILLIASQLVFA